MTRKEKLLELKLRQLDLEEEIVEAQNAYKKSERTHLRGRILLILGLIILVGGLLFTALAIIGTLVLIMGLLHFDSIDRTKKEKAFMDMKEEIRETKREILRAEYQ